LAEAYLRQSAVTPKEEHMAETALQQFQIVLQREPRNLIAIRSIAFIFLNQEKYTEAKQWYEKALEVNPRDKIALYSLGVIAWKETYPAVMSARLGSDVGPIKDNRVREEVREKYLAVVKTGITSLSKAIEIDKDYRDAMAYINLLYRLLAAMAADPGESQKYIDTADDWVTKALNVRMNTTGDPESVGDFWMAPHPPPPPPPTVVHVIPRPPGER
jgi:tetratricopeptide (TPR) repeat protein